MPSFSNGAKAELCATITDLDKQFACLYGILLFCKQLRRDEICIQSESAEFAELLPRLFHAVFHEDVTLQASKTGRGTDAAFYTFSVTDPAQVAHVLESYQITLPERTLKMTKLVTNSLSVFAAGAFLSCGSVTDPNKEYHLEYAVPGKRLADELGSLLSEIGVTPKYVQRKNQDVLYFKSSEQIEDLLTFMGAQQATIDFINIEILKNVRNKANRIYNCDLANINKVMKAAERQITDILFIDEYQGLEQLPQDLQEIALLRLENPELSLKELGELLQPPLGRSGVNHRLVRLEKLAQSLRQPVCHAGEREG